MNPSKLRFILVAILVVAAFITISVWTAVAWVHTAASYPQEVKAWLVGPNCRVFANGTMWLVEDMGGS